jgi:hypothetical protein
MSPAQHKRMQIRYLCVFKDLCDHFEIKGTKDYRAQITEWVLGHSRSSREFKGADFARLIDTMQAWINGDQEPGPLTEQERNHAAHDERAKQLVNVIEELADDEYIQKVCNDRIGKRPWRQLGVVQLTPLRNIIKARHSAAKAKGKTIKNRP